MSYRSFLRRLAADRRFTSLAVLTLSLGIGLTVAIFSVVHGVLLAPLPYPEPEKLVDVSHHAPGLDLEDMDISVPLYLRYRERVRSFEELALLRDGRVSLTGLDRPDRIREGLVTASLFRLAGVAPLLGRPFTEEDQRKEASPVVLVSEGFWRGRLGSDPGVLERTLQIDGTGRQIVGVLPASFALPYQDVEIWTPLVVDPEVQHLGQFSHRCIARLREGVSIPAALAELRGITDRLTEEFPGEQAAPVLVRSRFGPMVTPLLQQMVGDVRSALLVVAGAVGFVLLMSCVNVANLFLVRAESRRRELALRSALGASRTRILSEFLLEGLSLALAGAVLGLAVAHLAIQALVRFAPEGVPRLSEVSLDGTALGFALAVSVLSAMLIAVLPSLPYGRPDAAAALKDGGRGMTASRERIWVRRALVSLQMGIGLVLLVGAGLMVMSFRELSRVAPGFRPDSALTFRVSLPAASYESPGSVAALVDSATERLRALPGARAAGAVSFLPLTGSATGAGHQFEDFPIGDDDLPPVFITHFADPGYLEAMGIPLLEGRFLLPSDHQQGRRVVVVSESLARKHWPGGSALGRRIAPGDPEEEGWYEIVGVVGDVRTEDLQTEPRGTAYYPIRDARGRDVIGRNVSFVLRTEVPPDSLNRPAREAIWSLDPNVPITQTLALERLVSDARAPMAFNMSMMLLASALATVLGAVGTYGLISFVVGQRTHEIGVRMALGAMRGQVRGMVLRDGLRTVLPGLLLGVVAAFALTRMMASLLYAVSPREPAIFLLAPVLLLAVAVLATLLPAQRASRVNPLEALRQE